MTALQRQLVSEPEYRKLVRGDTAEAQSVLDGDLADPDLLPEQRFWISKLEVMTDLVSQHQVAAREVAERLHVEFGA